MPTASVLCIERGAFIACEHDITTNYELQFRYVLIYEHISYTRRLKSNYIINEVSMVMHTMDKISYIYLKEKQVLKLHKQTDKEITKTNQEIAKTDRQGDLSDKKINSYLEGTQGRVITLLIAPIFMMQSNKPTIKFTFCQGIKR